MTTPPERKRGKPPSKVHSIRIPEATLLMVTVAAKKHRVSLNNIINRWIEEGLEAESSSIKPAQTQNSP